MVITENSRDALAEYGSTLFSGRDLQRFKELYGTQLEVVHSGYELNGLRYLFSGGLNFRQLLPSFTERPLALLESLARPLARHWSLHQVIVLRRRT